MKAWLALRPGVHYRREAFANGLEACGLTVLNALPLRPEGVLVIWNRYGANAATADRFEAAGLPVLVAENGYLGNDFAGSRWYALAESQHNGAGTWPEGDPARWDSLGVTLAPWREGGSEVVLLPQRGIGPPGVRMPADWTERTLVKLRAHGIKARVRPHPGQGPCVELREDLQNARAVVTWGSGAALKAMAWGIPCYADMPGWIGSPGSLRTSALIAGEVLRDDERRTATFRRLAWAMWRLEEIATGRAFQWLLNLSTLASCGATRRARDWR